MQRILVIFDQARKRSLGHARLAYAGIMHSMETKDSRAILAENLRRMIDDAASKGARPSLRAWAMSRGLNVRLIDRLSKGQHAVTLDNLEEIARACNLKPWHLLYEGLDPVNPPLDPMTPEERDTLDRLRAILLR